jgi:hypothetical protein
MLKIEEVRIMVTRLLEKKQNMPEMSIGYHDLLNAIQTWTPEQKEVLLSDLQQMIHKDVENSESRSSRKKQPVTLEEFWQLLPDDLPELTDEEVEQIKVDWRVEKYVT